MEFLKLLGLFGLLTLDAALMEFSWLGYALWRDYRNDGLSFHRTRSVAPTPVSGIRTLPLVAARVAVKIYRPVTNVLSDWQREGQIAQISAAKRVVQRALQVSSKGLIMRNNKELITVLQRELAFLEASSFIEGAGWRPPNACATIAPLRCQGGNEAGFPIRPALATRLR